MEPVVVTGSGKQIVDWPLPPGTVALVDYEHTGRSNFIVYVLDGANEEVGGSLVNALRDTTGRRLAAKDNARHLDIKAEGPWTLTFRDLREARPFGSKVDQPSIEGHDDDVIAYIPSRPAMVNATFDGSSNFIVESYGTGGRSSIVFNELRTTTAQAALKAGFALWTVEAKGPWSFTLG